jgi:serine/threonine protein kinase
LIRRNGSSTGSNQKLDSSDQTKPATRITKMPSTTTFCTPRGKMLTQIKKIGEGAQGSAILVKDRRENVMTLKEIVVHKWSVESRLEAQREVDAMKASCSHPNVINYYDSWFDRSSLCILMEYAPNGSLDKILEQYIAKGKRFMQSQVTHYMQQLSSALDYCHNDLRIIHRDIKPGNILVDQLGNLKLGDFGLSKSLNENALCATYLGSPLYMAPEIIKGSVYTFGVDVWALGCVVYEVMALESPWIRGKNPTNFASLVNTIINDPPELKSLEQEYSPNLTKLVKWMLQKNVDRRATAKQLNDHFQIRAPPDFLTSILPASRTIHRQQDLVEQATRLAGAASVIQRSFRQSVHRERPREYYPEPAQAYDLPEPAQAYDLPEPAQAYDLPEPAREDPSPPSIFQSPAVPRYRPIAVPRRYGTPAAPRQVPARGQVDNRMFNKQPTAPPPSMVNRGESALKIQKQFRQSLNRHYRKYSKPQPAKGPASKYQVSERLERLATPRTHEAPPPLPRRVPTPEAPPPLPRRVPTPEGALPVSRRAPTPDNYARPPPPMPRLPHMRPITRPWM